MVDAGERNQAWRDGGRQLRVLLTKNVFLRCRRPKGTLLELFLPLVLFLGIVWVRDRYNTNLKTEGPFFYMTQWVFPLHKAVFDSVVVGPSKAYDDHWQEELRRIRSQNGPEPVFNDSNNSNSTWALKQGAMAKTPFESFLGVAEKTIGEAAVEFLACRESAADMMGNVGLRVLGEDTLLQFASAAEVDQQTLQATAALRLAQTWDINATMHTLDEARKALLDSEWLNYTISFSGVADEYIEKFQSEKDSVTADWLRTAIMNMTADLRAIMTNHNASSVVGNVEYFRREILDKASEAGLRAAINSFSEELQSQAAKKNWSLPVQWIAGNLSSGDVCLLADELHKPGLRPLLNDALAELGQWQQNITELLVRFQHLVSDASAEVADGIVRFNSSNLEQRTREAADQLTDRPGDASAIEAELRRALRTLQVLLLDVPATVNNAVRKALYWIYKDDNKVAQVLERQVTDMTGNTAGRGWSDRISNLVDTSEIDRILTERLSEDVKSALWYTSHFLDARSPMVRVLGAMYTETNNTDALAKPHRMLLNLFWRMMVTTLEMRDKMPGIVAQANSTLTELTGMMLGEGFATLGDAAGTWNVTEYRNMLQHMQTGVADMAKWWHSHSLNMSDCISNNPSNQSLSFLLREAVNLRNSGLDIWNHTMPKLTAFLRTECQEKLGPRRNLTDLIAHAYKSCSWCQDILATLARNATQPMLQAAADHIKQWNSSELSTHLFNMQGFLNRTIDADAVDASTRRIIQTMQERLKKELPVTTGSNGWNKIQLQVSLGASVQQELLTNLCHSRRLVGSQPQQGQQLECRRQVCENGEWSLPGMSESTGSMNMESRRRSTSPTSKRNNPQEWMMEALMKRKLLVAPYKGEAKDLVKFTLIELSHSITMADWDDYPQHLKLLAQSPLVKALLASLAEGMLGDRILGFASEKDLQRYAVKKPHDVLGGLVFSSADANGNFPVPLDVQYKIRLHAQFLPATDRILKMSGMFGRASPADNLYLFTGFAYVQETMGRSAARLRALRAEHGRRLFSLSPLAANARANERTEPGRRMGVSGEFMPAPKVTLDYFMRVIQHTMPMILVLGWIYSVSMLVKEMVYEKQERLREVMRIMGLKTWVYWFSWMGFAMLQMTILVMALTLILCGGGVLVHSDPTAVFAFLWLYSLATVSFCSLVSSFFSRAKIAAACGGLLYYLSYIPYSLYNRFEDIMSFNAKNAFCLLSPTGLGIGSSMLAKWEMIGEGIQWKTLFLAPPVTYSGATPKDNHSMGNVYMMFIIDSILYQVLAWYIEKVFPGTFGLPQPWYFPILPSFWGFRKSTPDMEVDEAAANAEEQPERKDNAILECYEAPPHNLEILVKLRRLEKVYRNGKRALNGVSLDMHRDTILGLLGHNGAGKSTTMAILMGLYPPTKGDVFVGGQSVRQDCEAVRRQLGVCLQSNALYETLTVQEHLRLFACMKGTSWRQTPAEVEVMIKDTGLHAKTHALSSSLSGGMKRKLSIGIALVGGSVVVALDEPTAGVDASSRREIWRLLVGQKRSRALLLSTHFMDEADILSDRIAIIAEGRLTAIGTSMALKQHYANTNTLTFVLRPGYSFVPASELVMGVVPEAVCVGVRGREVCYQLPSTTRSKFPELFALLENSEVRQRLGVDTYGLSAATMEEVFLEASSMQESGLSGRVRNGLPGSSEQPAFAAPARMDSISTEADGSEANASTADDTGSLGSNPVERMITPDTRSESSSNKNETRAAVSSTFDVDTIQEPASGSSSSHLPSDSQRATGPKDTSIKKEAWTIDGKLVGEAKPGKVDKNMTDTTCDTTAKKEAWTTDGNVALDASQVVVDTNTADLTESGPMLWSMQFSALFVKRAKSVMRDRRAWISQLVLPAIFVILSLLIAMIREIKTEDPPLCLNTDMYIGTMAAGSTTQNLEKHIMPFQVETSLGATAAENVTRAIQAAVAGTDDVLHTVSTAAGGLPLSRYLMENRRDLRATTFGAISLVGQPDQPSILLWLKAGAYHALPTMVNFWNRARLNLLGFDDMEVQAWSHPLPKTRQLLQEEMTGGHQLFTDMTVAITIILAMAFIPASFVVYLVHEKASNAKHQQLLSGVSPLMYWITNYCWDLVNMMLPVLICFSLCIAFGLAAYSGPNAIAILVLLIAYGFCMTPLMYVATPLFSIPSTAYVTLICLNIFTGTVSVIASVIMDMYQTQLPDIKDANVVVKAIFPWLLPNYCLGRGMMDIAANYYINLISTEFGYCMDVGGQFRPVDDTGSCFRNPLSWDVAGHFVVKLMLMAPVWLALNLLIEWRFFVPFLRAKMARLFHTSSAAWMLQTEQGQLVEDMDVQHEKQRVDQALQRWTRATPIEDKLVLTNLRKSFLAKGNMCGGRRKTVHAVRGLSVGVPGGECFGLLGVNGAGKTTTMRMITGDTEVSSGDILVDGWSIRHKRDRARRQLGYCPQFDALPDKLTVWETVMLYARLRGVPWMQVNSVVNDMIQKMCLEAHKKTLCECLSGGNKRKLSTALSLIGQPKVVLLDEPSTGVDVGARRFLWEILSDITRSGHALVLTSHSMEECQVLCTRLAIMNFGQFACMGSPLQLRDKYGGGYTLTMKVNSTANAEADENERPGYKVQEFVREHIPEANLSEENVGLLRYRLASRSDAPCLAEAFRALEAETVEGGKLHGLMADYAVSQTSLEEVFLHFSNQAPRESSGPSENSARGKCCNIMSQHRGSRLASDIEDNQLPEDDTSPPSVRGTPRGPLDDGRAKPVPL